MGWALPEEARGSPQPQTEQAWDKPGINSKRVMSNKKKIFLAGMVDKVDRLSVKFNVRGSKDLMVLLFFLNF